MRVLLSFSLKSTTGCVGLGPLGRDSGTDQRQMLPVTSPGPHVRSLEVNQLPLLGLEVQGPKLHTEASFHKYLPVAGQQRAQGIYNYNSICLLPVRLSH